MDAIAVTYAPGLIGALLVGVNFAKAAALALNIPIIPVHHIRGHIAANYIAFPELEPPFVCLSVSGGNTLILDVRDYTDTRIMGSSRDDAAGECFDKVARVLGMPYPGGKALDDKSKTGDPSAYHLPRSKVDGAPLDMSFSGLKIRRIEYHSQCPAKGGGTEYSRSLCQLCLRSTGYIGSQNHGSTEDHRLSKACHCRGCCSQFPHSQCL